jgi:hypothetical protein
MPIMNTASSQPTSPPAIALRDLFAGQVLAAMIVAPKQPGVTRLEMDDMAKMSYQYADAMLKVR